MTTGVVALTGVTVVADRIASATINVLNNPYGGAVVVIGFDESSKILGAMHVQCMGPAA